MNNFIFVVKILFYKIIASPPPRNEFHIRILIKIYKPDGEADGEADCRAFPPTASTPHTPQGAHNENPSLVALGKNSILHAKLHPEHDK